MQNILLQPEGTAAPDGYQAQNTKLTVFISYSRSDMAVADALVTALEASEFTVLIDRRDLPYGEEWQVELADFIRASDTVIWLVSPSSIDSKWCRWELSEVARLNKRLVPVAITDVDRGELPEGLGRIHLLPTEGVFVLDKHLQVLVDTLNTDRHWVKEHTRLAERARQWLAKDRNSSLLLRGAALNDAESWADRKPKGAPPPSDEILELILASRRATTRRMRNTVFLSLSVGVVSIGLAIAAYYQRQLAETNRVATVRTLATADFQRGAALLQSDEETSEGIAFLARAVRQGGDKRALKRLWTLLQQRGFWLPTGQPSNGGSGEPQGRISQVPDAIKTRFSKLEFNGTMVEADFISVSGDGKRVFTAVNQEQMEKSRPRSYRIWNVDGSPVTPWLEPIYKGENWVYSVKGYLSFDGTYLAIEVMGWRETSHLQIFDLQSKKQIGDDIIATGHDLRHQLMGYSLVQFVSFPTDTLSKNHHVVLLPRLLLLTASEKGDATVYAIYRQDISKVATNSHSREILYAGIDSKAEWLLSASADSTVRISNLRDRTPVGNVLHYDAAVKTIMRTSDSDIAVTTEDGKQHYLTLQSPIKVALPNELGISKDAFHCNRWDNIRYLPKGESKDTLQAANGDITRRDKYQLVVSNKSAEIARSPRFSSEIVLTCLNEARDRVAVTTKEFVTEVWSVDFSTKFGPSINERRLFAGQTPEIPRMTILPNGGNMIAIESFVWNSPNLAQQWYSVWDLSTSLPLTDRAIAYQI